MSTGNVDVVQLGPKQVAITLNKNALLQLKEGRGVGVDLKSTNGNFRVLLMRDTEFHAKFSQFKELAAKEERKAKALGFWGKFLKLVGRGH